MIPGVTHHWPKPWWFRLAERFMPGRTREIPEAVNPDRMVLRQVAIVKRYAYLQQFASGEDPRWYHSHQWLYTVALGFWGHYREHRPAGVSRKRSAPYLYWMDSSVIHHVLAPSKGHTSIFIGFFRRDLMKHYFPSPTVGRRLWSEHIQVQVKRI